MTTQDVDPKTYYAVGNGLYEKAGKLYDAFSVNVKILGETGSMAGTDDAGTRLKSLGRKGKPEGTAPPRPSVKIPDTAPKSIDGYTKHAEDQIAGRDGGIGVRREALEDAFQRPTRDVERLVDGQGRVSYRYNGENATVVVNEQGRVITGWANNGSGTVGGSGGQPLWLSRRRAGSTAERGVESQGSRPRGRIEPFQLDFTCGRGSGHVGHQRGVDEQS